MGQLLIVIPIIKLFDRNDLYKFSNFSNYIIKISKYKETTFQEGLSINSVESRCSLHRHLVRGAGCKDKKLFFYLGINKFIYRSMNMAYHFFI